MGTGSCPKSLTFWKVTEVVQGGEAPRRVPRLKGRRTSGTGSRFGAGMRRAADGPCGPATRCARRALKGGMWGTGGGSSGARQKDRVQEKSRCRSSEQDAPLAPPLITVVILVEGLRTLGGGGGMLRAPLAPNPSPCHQGPGSVSDPASQRSPARFGRNLCGFPPAPSRPWNWV